MMVNDDNAAIDSWTQTAKLTGSPNSFFGSSVAVAGNWILVGALVDFIGAGAVYGFTTTASSSSWTQMTRLLAADGEPNSSFGRSVSISKDASTMVVGAYLVDFNDTIPDSGAAYLFRTSNSTTTTSILEWTEMGKFVASDRDTKDWLGSSVAIENNIVVVGAAGDDSFTGSVHVVDSELGFSSSTATAVPSIAPTLQPIVFPTYKPTPSLTTNATKAPRPDNNNNSTPTAPIPSIIPTTTPSLVTETDDASSDPVFTRGVIVVSAIVVVGVVLIAVVIAMLYYRIKVQIEAQEQQRHPTTMIMADIVLESLTPPPVQEERTALEAEAFLDPTSTAAAVLPTAIAAMDNNNAAKKSLPMYKDQVRNLEPPGQSTNRMHNDQLPVRQPVQQHNEHQIHP
jgi:hypothetical protein